MNSLDVIKRKIQKLYETQPQIHVNVCISKPRVRLSNETVLIKGVYPHFFQLEEYSTGMPKIYTIQYTDVLTKQIQIAELADG